MLPVGCQWRALGLCPEHAASNGANPTDSVAESNPCIGDALILFHHVAGGQRSPRHPPRPMTEKRVKPKPCAVSVRRCLAPSDERIAAADVAIALRFNADTRQGDLLRAYLYGFCTALGLAMLIAWHVFAALHRLPRLPDDLPRPAGPFSLCSTVTLSRSERHRARELRHDLAARAPLKMFDPRQ